MNTVEGQLTIAARAMGSSAAPCVAFEAVRHWDRLWELTACGLIVIGIAAIGYFQFHAIVPRVLVVAASRSGIRLAAYVGILCTVMGFKLIVVRTILWMLYGPAAAASREQAPSLTVVIPA